MPLWLPPTSMMHSGTGPLGLPSESMQARRAIRSFLQERRRFPPGAEVLQADERELIELLHKYGYQIEGENEAENMQQRIEAEMRQAEKRQQRIEAERRQAEKRRQWIEAEKMWLQEAEKERKQKAEDLELEQIKDELLKKVKQNKWEAIVKLYKEQPKARKAKITRSRDTALHIAVSDGQEQIVKSLVDSIGYQVEKGKEVSESEKEDTSPLKIANDRGNIPLHLAASIGNVGMCKCLIFKHPELVGARNFEGETPLFLAALHGKKDVFLCLHQVCGPEQGYSYCRRGDGETILHCAIAGEHFDLAYQILQHYEGLVHWVNEKGLTPLHILATKPAAFRSGTHLSWFNQITYNCINVEELHKESSTHHNFQETSEAENYPDNYKTCVHLFQLPAALLRGMIKILGTVPVARRNNTTPTPDVENPAREEGHRSSDRTQERCHYQSSYVNKFTSKASEMLAILGKVGWGPIDNKKIRVKKQKNVWSAEIMNKLLDKDIDYTAGTHGGLDWLSMNKERDGTYPYRVIEEIDDYVPRRETPIVVAAKNGIAEMVEKILERNPGSILDVDFGGKNTVLLAVEHRQTQLYEKLVSRKPLDERAFRVVDDDGNSALHLAATLSDYQPYRFAALQMQWELKWYKYVKNSVPQYLFSGRNNANMTPKDMFKKSHKDLVEKGGQWLSSTSNSCSLVATLITTVAFATTASVPGGMKENSSRPNLEQHPGFIVFAVSSLIALSFSVTSVITFLVILTSRYHQKDFKRDLPRKLLLGLTSLFISLGAMLVCFCASHFFLLKDKLKLAAFPLYAVACVPVIFFAIMQFPFYFDLIMATFKKVPQRMPYG